MGNTKKKNLRKRIEEIMEIGYSQSELARFCEVSRTTLYKLLNDRQYTPQKSVQARILRKIDFLEKSDGTEKIEFLALFNTDYKEIDRYMKGTKKIVEEITHYEVGYHAKTIGEFPAFMFYSSPGRDTIAPGRNVLPDYYINSRPTHGDLEFFSISNYLRKKGKKSEAYAFSKEYPQARVFLSFFKNINFTVGKDFNHLLTLLDSVDNKKRIFCLDAGTLTGKRGMFLLLAAKDITSFYAFLSDKNGMGYKKRGVNPQRMASILMVVPMLVDFLKYHE